MIAKTERFLGINNTDNDRHIQKYEFGEDIIILSGDLKSCVDFRIPKTLKPEVRNGRTSKLVTTALTTIWVSKDGNTAIFADGATLKLLNSDYTATTLYSSLYPEKDIAIAEHNAKIFLGNGSQMLKYESGAISAWADTSQMAEEFEMPRRVYRGLPLSDIILSYYARMYAAYDRFVFYSEAGYPERFRKTWYLTCPETVTALSHDDNTLYAHTLNWTVPFIGRDPDDFMQMEAKNIGAIKHYPCIPHAVPDQPIWMSKKGWATAQSGKVQYIDNENFRLDLPDTARCYAGYDPIEKEIVCPIRY